MKCKECETIFSANYKKCPECGSEAFEPEKFKQQFIFDDEVEPIDPFVVCAEIELDE